MRTVKVRILPPQPNFLPRIAVKLASADLIPILIPVNSRCFPSTQYLSTKGDFMSRRAEVALYRIYATEKSHQCVRIVRSGRGWTPNPEAVDKPGSFYLLCLLPQIILFRSPARRTRPCESASSRPVTARYQIILDLEERVPESRDSPWVAVALTFPPVW
jgi:hypothetical protein